MMKRPLDLSLRRKMSTQDFVLFAECIQDIVRRAVEQDALLEPVILLGCANATEGRYDIEVLATNEVLQNNLGAKLPALLYLKPEYDFVCLINHGKILSNPASQLKLQKTEDVPLVLSLFSREKHALQILHVDSFTRHVRTGELIVIGGETDAEAAALAWMH